GPPETAKLLVNKINSSPLSSVIKTSHNQRIVPPSEILEPPRLNVFQPEQTGLMVPLNQPIFREGAEMEYNRIAEEEKSLEDKADALLRILEKEKDSPKEVKPKNMVENMGKSNEFVFIRSKPLDLEENPEFVQYFKSPHTTSASSNEVSVAALYYVIASIFLVLCIIFRSIQNRKRITGKHRNRFRI
ncbi:unnamed protein product, partial [Meganyctiphanes norvegica]